MTDDPHPVRPDAGRVARRALILSALVCRGYVEADPANPEALSLNDRITEWLARLDLEDEIEPLEAAVLSPPPGAVPAQVALSVTRQAEGLAILAWALGLFPLPRHDQKVDAYEVTDALYFLGEDDADLVATAKLRTEADIDACREVMYAVHCRLRELKRRKERNDFGSWIEQEWLDLLGLDSTGLIVEGDLGIDGRPLSAVEPDRVQDCEWVFRERHRAAIWLAGEDPLYSELTVDT
jgi:uncharacterized protein DUF4272